MEIRPARSDDADAVAEIALLTGDGGQDATALITEPRLIAEVFVLPYLAHAPETSLVLEENGRVMGCAVGALDTRVFEARLGELWWPEVRARYQGRLGGPLPLDRYYAVTIARPPACPAALVARFPAHMHQNLHPAAQGKGQGRRLGQAWLTLAVERGAQAVHIGANPNNARGMAYWQSLGLRPVNTELGLGTDTAWLAKRLL